MLISIKHNYFQLKEKHRFHMVTNSILPLAVAIAAGLCLTGIESYWHQSICTLFHKTQIFFSENSFNFFFMVLFLWVTTVIFESILGCHTKEVSAGLRLGMILFIISEIMLFVAFFWGFFHVSLTPAITLGCIWPPKGMQALDIWGLPLVNTCLLLTSGLFLTIGHRALLTSFNFFFYGIVIVMIFLTIWLGSLFLGGQFIEYKYAISFSWMKSVYGSIFFVTTGFHGFHVTIGTIFLLYCLIRVIVTTLRVNNFTNINVRVLANNLSSAGITKEQHVGFESAAWYWHFVDVVWIFLFIVIYWLDNKN